MPAFAICWSPLCLAACCRSWGQPLCQNFEGGPAQTTKRWLSAELQRRREASSIMKEDSGLGQPSAKNYEGGVLFCERGASRWNHEMWGALCRNYEMYLRKGDISAGLKCEPELWWRVRFSWEKTNSAVGLTDSHQGSMPTPLHSASLEHNNCREGWCRLG